MMECRGWSVLWERAHFDESFEFCGLFGKHFNADRVRKSTELFGHLSRDRRESPTH